MYNYDVMVVVNCICKYMVLFRCRHRNLVELMGFCVTSPALVYEFMERGNLHYLIHTVGPIPFLLYI